MQGAAYLATSLKSPLPRSPPPSHVKLHWANTARAHPRRHPLMSPHSSPCMPTTQPMPTSLQASVHPFNPPSKTTHNMCAQNSYGTHIPRKNKANRRHKQSGPTPRPKEVSERRGSPKCDDPTFPFPASCSPAWLCTALYTVSAPAEEHVGCAWVEGSVSVRMLSKMVDIAASGLAWDISGEPVEAAEAGPSAGPTLGPLRLRIAVTSACVQRFDPLKQMQRRALESMRQEGEKWRG